MGDRAMTDELPPAPRTVRPRSRKYKRLPIVVVSRDGCVNEDGEYLSLTNLPNMPSTLFVTQGAGDFVAGLDEAYSVSHPDSWQWRVSTQEKGVMHPGGVRIAARVTTVVHYFGFKNGNYHKIIDPVVVYGRGLDSVWPGDEPTAVKLMRWAQALRDFCDENGMEVRPTIGSMSGQFLTDQRFYPRARRKVPRAINDRARENLPGNHYALNVVPASDREFTAWYVDQRRAHHYHAATTPLPDADNLYAHGRFTDLGDIAFDTVHDDFHGLYCLHLQIPRARRRALGVDSWIKPHAKHDFVFSNELPLLLEMGYVVNGVIAAWGSHQRDCGLSRYATWATIQLNRYSDAPWLKPLLLATYGTLATRPSWGETIFKLAKKGEAAEVYTGRRKLAGLQTQKPHKLEPGIANVIHRGMIEAATRVSSIALSQALYRCGFRVLSIYADAVIVEQPADGQQLPDLPEPWRVKTTLTHLQFISQQAFMSGEMTKLPGVSGDIKRYARNHRVVTPRKFYDVFGRRVQTDRRI